MNYPAVLAAVIGGAILSASATFLILGRGGGGDNVPVNAPRKHQPVVRVPGPLREEVQTSRFLTDSQWTAALRGIPPEEILQIASELTPEYWKSHPLAESSAYRLFGAIAAARKDDAFTDVSQYIDRGSSDKSRLRPVVRWAFLGILETLGPRSLEECLPKVQRDYWPELIQASVFGRDSGGIENDMSALKEVVSRLLHSETDQAESGRLMISALEAWAQRDPFALLTWLQTPAGKPYASQFSGRVAIDATTVEKAAALLNDPKSPLGIEELANACYMGAWGPADIVSLASKIPSARKNAFLLAYSKKLAGGNPSVLVDFAERVDAAALDPEFAAALGPLILAHAPQLFGKIATNLRAEQRDDFLDLCYKKMIPRTGAASRFYLNEKGVAGLFAAEAIGDLSLVDFPAALALIKNAPDARREELAIAAYRSRSSLMMAKGESPESIFSFLENIPAGAAAQEAKGYVVSALTHENPSKALEFLDRYYPQDADLWVDVFRNADLPPKKLDEFLEKKIASGISPSVYSAAAIRLTEEFFDLGINDAQNAVEELQDPQVKADCTEKLVSRWGWVDPLSAFTYVTQLPSGMRRDKAIAALASKLSFDPQKRDQLLSLASSDDVRAAMQSASLPGNKASR